MIEILREKQNHWRKRKRNIQGRKVHTILVSQLSKTLTDAGAVAGSERESRGQHHSASPLSQPRAGVSASEIWTACVHEAFIIYGIIATDHVRWAGETWRISRNKEVVDKEWRSEEKSKSRKDEAAIVPIPIVLRYGHQTPIAMLMPPHIHSSLFISFIQAFAGTSVHIKGFFSHRVKICWLLHCLDCSVRLKSKWSRVVTNKRRISCQARFCRQSQSAPRGQNASMNVRFGRHTFPRQFRGPTEKGSIASSLSSLNSASPNHLSG